MGSGFIIGGIWGLIVATGALAVASLVAEQPAGSAPPAAPQVAAPEVAPADEPERTEPVIAGSSGPQINVQAELKAEPVLDMAPDTPRVDVPAGGGTPPVADTATATVPRTAAEADGPTPAAAPETASEPKVDVAEDQPVLPSPQSRVIRVPAAEADITISTEAPPSPSSGSAAGTETEQPVESVASPSADERPRITDLPDLPVERDGPEVQQAEATAPQNRQITTITVAPDAPELPRLPRIGERPGIRSQPDSTEPRTDAVPTADAEAPATNGMPGGDTGVRIRRLGSTTEVPQLETSAAAPDATALQRYAAPNGGSAGLPQLSVTLIDDGALADAIPAVSSIPFPVTIAIDPEAENATERMTDWRSAGFEVVALARLPQGARPSDVEVVYRAAFDALPESVAVLDAGAGGLTSDSAVTAQALEHLAEDGRGLASVSQGLATPVRLARSSGVPAVEIFRDLDGDGQNSQGIRRVLDQAAFRARQTGAVALVARVRPETISALTLWGTQNRSDQVARVPMSAVLQSPTQTPGN